MGFCGNLGFSDDDPEHVMANFVKLHKEFGFFVKINLNWMFGLILLYLHPQFNSIISSGTAKFHNSQDFIDKIEVQHFQEME